jgi:hypothetical protein
MHLRVIACALFVTAAMAAAQGQGTADRPGGRGHFGAPVVRFTVVRGQFAWMLGGRGGVNLTPSLVLGAGAYGTMNGVEAPEAVPYAPGPFDVKLETFGLDLDYAPRPSAPAHLTLGVYLGGAADRYVRRGTDEQHGETDFMLLLEPSVGLERRLTESVHVNLAASYRLVSGVEQVGLEESDFIGPAAELTVKIGRF